MNERLLVRGISLYPWRPVLRPGAKQSRPVCPSSAVVAKLLLMFCSVRAYVGLSLY